MQAAPGKEKHNLGQGSSLLLKSIPGKLLNYELPTTNISASWENRILQRASGWHITACTAIYQAGGGYRFWTNLIFCSYSLPLTSLMHLLFPFSPNCHRLDLHYLFTKILWYSALPYSSLSSSVWLSHCHHEDPSEVQILCMLLTFVQWHPTAYKINFNNSTWRENLHLVSISLHNFISVDSTNCTYIPAKF